MSVFPKYSSRFTMFPPSKDNFESNMRCSLGSTVDTKISSSFLLYSSTAISSITKTQVRNGDACTAQNDQPPRHVFLSPRSIDERSYVQGAAALGNNIKSSPLTFLPSLTSLSSLTKTTHSDAYVCAPKVYGNKGMFFSLSKTTGADLYTQGVSSLAIYIQLSPGILLA